MSCRFLITKNMSDNSILQTAANEARGLAIDAISARASGHLGLPLGCAEIGAVLFGEILKFNPKNPSWLDRDRFVLSAGHGSMFIYAWLHICGYDLSLEDIKNFRIRGSKTPGHPEYGVTPGVEATAGPLGQGVGNAVGMAISEKMAESRFNSDADKIFDHKVWCLAGDGCMQEGISQEAISLAGTLKLDNLILMYDSNDVTLDAMAAKTMSEDTGARFKACGWRVLKCDGHDIDAVRKTLKSARRSADGKPTLVIFKTTIAKGIPEVENSAKGHGEGGAKFADSARKALGLPDEKFFVSPQTREFFAARAKKLARLNKKWDKLFAAWKASNPGKADDLEACLTRRGTESAEAAAALVPEFPASDAATRASGGAVMNFLAKKLPFMVTGSADLFGSTKNYLKDMGDFSADTPSGRNIWFGIREHAMGAISNGIAYDGIFLPSCATFLTFAGYMMGSIRIAALSRLPVQYIFTHDSIGVGMDGPTHQPVELVSQLRSMPRLDVIRPADAEECAAAWAMALSRKDGPTALILSRQNLPAIASLSASEKRSGTLRGAYVIRQEKSELNKIIIASGSEVSVALKAAEEESGTRVVSMPCMEVFERQSHEYRQSVLPDYCQNRIAIEAGVGGLWYKYAKKIVSTDDFGFSADSPELFKAFNITPEALRD